MIKEEDKPFIPPNTCTYIDQVIELVEQLRDNNFEKDIDFKERMCSVIKQQMELIRSSNQYLRDSSYFWYTQYKKVKPVASKKKGKK